MGFAFLEMVCMHSDAMYLREQEHVPACVCVHTGVDFILA